jgi:Fe-S-cluster containining protein
MTDGAPPPGPLTPPVLPEERRVGPDLVRAIEEMVDDLARHPYSADLAHRLEWVIDMLVARGHLTPGHRRLAARIKDASGVVRLATYPDKRAVVGPDIDCASRLHLCHGRCCSYAVSLSQEDLAEGRLAWDLHHPYALPKDPATGYCACLGGDGRCTVYADRPGTCRAYDCRGDPRVWIDFDARIPAPLPAHLHPPAGMGRPPDEPG